MITVIGETVADTFVPAHQPTPGALDLRVRPGGGPANTAVALGRLGAPVTFAGRIPAGPLGDLLRAYLSDSDVDLSRAVTAAEQATLALAAVDGDGHAQYSFYANGTADFQWTTEELAAATPSEAACVHAGSLALALEPSGPLIEKLLHERRTTTTISIDPNIRPGIVPAERYRRLLPGWTSAADVFRLSSDDLAVLRPGASLPQACDDWHADGVRLVVITCGADGAYASLDGQRFQVPARPVTPVDTVGAGDAFTAGLLYRLHTGGALRERLADLTPDLLIRALTFASDVAAETCRKQGADPPRLADLAA
ncbi:carbohydrate kinase family protein [Actinomadura rudentiformis]|uniref:Carbohydrate kinase n=1 Tax=Actinomadura rudentiformis TaxID=359158 RepID=A0A6H9YG97_9ACTN|nr:carbohydrate kinase [Actinomadura rudentiformis]KAB2345202.1 carbohydrate kinase [Actinomadura rudentiformis]